MMQVRRTVAGPRLAHEIVDVPDQCPRCIGGQLFLEDDKHDGILGHCLQCGHRVISGRRSKTWRLLHSKRDRADEE